MASSLTFLFTKGQFVHQGDLLAEIDPRPYEVALEQANGALAQAKGTLERDQAALRDAEVEIPSAIRSFTDSQIIAKQQLDTQLATADQARGSIAADQAGDCGSAGRHQQRQPEPHIYQDHRSDQRQDRPPDRWTSGNMVHASDANGLAVITQLQPISVLFSLPEEQLPSVLVRLRQGAKLPRPSL